MTQPALDELLGAMKTRLGRSPGYRAEFVQRRRLRVFMDDLVSTGTCSFAPPAGFRWEVREPYRSLLVLNGDQVGRFEDEDGRMRPVQSGDRDAIRQMLAPMMAMMRGDFGAAGETFRLSGETGIEYRIHLEPRDAKLRRYIERIVVRVERGQLEVTALQIQEPGGDVIDIEFRARREAPLDPRLFDTKAPQADPRKEDG
jgi:outer membrane lipoprotein-sorting protein